MSDILNLTGDHWARQEIADAWRAAGSPPLNSAGRLYGPQKELFDGWCAGLPGYNPADDPDDETQQLAHVRFVALDIDPTPARVAALERAGLVRPYKHEPWHWTLPGDMRRFPIVRELPTPNQEEEMIAHIGGKAGKRSAGLWLLANGQATFLASALHNPLTSIPHIPNETAVIALSKKYKGLPV